MFKRSFDIFFAFISIVVFSPVILLICVLIRLGSRGPVFYRGVRTGLNGKPFRIFKFRTMVEDAEKIGGPSTALNDPRLTKTGKFLRKYKLDELPQLINILMGEMSIVGPRPQVEKYTKAYKGEEEMILSVRPGLTDFASIRFINLDKVLGDDRVDEKYIREVEPEKNRLRLRYVQERTMWVDIKIIYRTFLRMLRIKALWNIRY
ncbi:MAG: sugar transferase [Deltaproteobacteria bacterium]|nr:sugar transferase [Deltaproteobacteria bacterium]